MVDIWALRTAEIAALGRCKPTRVGVFALHAARVDQGGVNVRVAFAVPSSFGCAVRRNRVRRIIRELVRQQPGLEGVALFIRVRGTAAEALSDDGHSARRQVAALLSDVGSRSAALPTLFVGALAQ